MGEREKDGEKQARQAQELDPEQEDKDDKEDKEKNTLIERLKQPQVWPHGVTAVTVVETHISWILLTGTYAYKLKKPVDFGFLDFSTLARRYHACREELRLNRRLAPELYLDVVAIRGTPQAPRVEDAGEGAPEPAQRGADAPIEYAVKMRQFDPERQLDRELAYGRLSAEDMEEVAREVARFHAHAPRAEGTDAWGHPETAMAPVRENFNHLRASLADAPALRARLDPLEAWSEARFEALHDRLVERRAGGQIRECHGDLHLSNLTRLETGIRAFDCIEFNPALRWIDTISDAAFLFMDLLSRARKDLAWRFLNVYLETSGDYRGMALLRFYTAYRTLVRAKVAALQRSQRTDAEARAELDARVDLHLQLAEALMAPPQPVLVLMQGVSGSGKTRLARPLTDRTGAVHVRSDVERKRLYGLGPLADSSSRVEQGLYTAGASDRTYERLCDLAAELLAAGHPVLVDATFLTRARRAPFLELARRLDIPLRIVACEAPEDVLRDRVRRRAARGGDASEADEAVLEMQLARRQPVDVAEGIETVTVDTTKPVDLERLAESVGAGTDPRRSAL